MEPHRDVDSLPAVMLLLHLLLVTQPGAGRHWSVSAAHACATPSPVPAAALPITPHVSPELITALSLLATWGRLSLVPAWPGCAARSAAAAWSSLDSRRCQFSLKECVSSDCAGAGAGLAAGRAGARTGRIQLQAVLLDLLLLNQNYEIPNKF